MPVNKHIDVVGGASVFCDVFVMAYCRANADGKPAFLLAANDGVVRQAGTAAGHDRAAAVRNGAAEFGAMIDEQGLHCSARGTHDANFDARDFHCRIHTLTPELTAGTHGT